MTRQAITRGSAAFDRLREAVEELSLIGNVEADDLADDFAAIVERRLAFERLRSRFDVRVGGQSFGSNRRN